jgi:hypothetical protein
MGIVEISLVKKLVHSIPNRRNEVIMNQGDHITSHQHWGKLSIRLDRFESRVFSGTQNSGSKKDERTLPN